MSTELAKFNPLKAEIDKFIKPTLSIKVLDFASSQSAIEAAKVVKGYLNDLDKKRRELVDPLNAKVKEINEYVKSLRVPLDQAEAHIKTQLSAFAAEQERIKREEIRRAEEERRRKEEELRAKQEAERQALAEAKPEECEIAAMFGVAPEPTETVAAFEEKASQELAQLNSEHAQAVWDASQKQIKNTRKTLKVRVVDINQVPKEFLIIEVNTKAALAAGKAGVKIPGLEFFEEISVAIGSKTYVPKRALGE